MLTIIACVLVVSSTSCDIGWHVSFGYLATDRNQQTVKLTVGVTNQNCEHKDVTGDVRVTSDAQCKDVIHEYAFNETSDETNDLGPQRAFKLIDSDARNKWLTYYVCRRKYEGKEARGYDAYRRFTAYLDYDGKSMGDDKKCADTLKTMNALFYKRDLIYASNKERVPSVLCMGFRSFEQRPEIVPIPKQQKQRQRKSRAAVFEDNGNQTAEVITVDVVEVKKQTHHPMRWTSRSSTLSGILAFCAVLI